MQEELDQELTMSEMKKAIFQMKDNKVPGNDGLGVEFYKRFYHKIKYNLFEVIKEAATDGWSHTSRRGIIALIEKAQKDPLWIDHWRPLNLLNVDFKIMGKILANRLNKITAICINDDQVGFVQKRHISENLMELITALEYIEKRQEQFVLISFDFKKAFDCVEHEPLLTILRKFNIGNKYIQLVANYLKDLESCTMNMGSTSKYIKIERGLRQGDPLSAPIFLFVVEVLAQKIRDNREIKGMEVEGKKKILSQFADDLWALIKAEQKSYEQIIKTFENFAENTDCR